MVEVGGRLLSTAQLFLQKNGTFLVKFFQFGDTRRLQSYVADFSRNDQSQNLQGLNRPNFTCWHREKKVRIRGFGLKNLLMLDN